VKHYLSFKIQPEKNQCFHPRHSIVLEDILDSVKNKIFKAKGNNKMSKQHKIEATLKESIPDNLNLSTEVELSDSELEIVAGGNGPCRQCYDPDGNGCKIETQQTTSRTNPNG
jgi:hypothetical protein